MAAGSSKPAVLDQNATRPPNSYRLGAALDKAVCTRALALLNEPEPPPHISDHPLAHDTNFFLKTSASVTWTPTITVYTHLLTRQGLPERHPDRQTVELDLFNNGSGIQVHRYWGTLHDHAVAILWSTPHVLTEPATPPDQATPRTFVQQMPPELRLSRLELGGFRTKGIPAALEKAPLTEALRSAWYLLAEIMQIDETMYLLVTASRNIGVPKPWQVYLLRSRSNTEHEFLCEFKSRFAIAR